MSKSIFLFIHFDIQSARVNYSMIEKQTSTRVSNSVECTQRARISLAGGWSFFNQRRPVVITTPF